MSNWVLVFLAGINSTIGNVLLKLSQSKSDFLSSVFSITFIAGCFFYMLNVLLFAYAIKELDVSKAYPALVVISILSLASVGVFFLGEHISFLNAVGIALLLCGVFLVTR